MKRQTEPNVFRDINRNGEMQNALKSNEIFQKQSSDLIFSANNPLFPFGTCLDSHSGKQFICVYKKCLDHTNCFRNEIPDENPDYHALRFFPEDRELWCEHAFPDILRFTESLSILDFQDFRFSFNHRYIRHDGSVSQFLHEGTLSVKSSKNLPELSLQVFTEIGDIKTDDSIVLSIFKHSSDWGYQKIFNKVYPNIRVSLLTARELEIIRLCQEGFSSKMIADKLKLSIHTVKNHKRKSMEKTFTHNINELIHTCLQNHWL